MRGNRHDLGSSWEGVRKVLTYYAPILPSAVSLASFDLESKVSVLPYRLAKDCEEPTAAFRDWPALVAGRRLLWTVGWE